MKVLYDIDIERTKMNLDNTETTRQEETIENEAQERSSQKNKIELYWPHTGVKEEIKKTSV